MSTVRMNWKGVVAVCATTLLLSASSAHSQESQPGRILTIADCPPGYILGVESTNSLLPLNKVDPSQSNPNAYVGGYQGQNGQGQDATAYAAAQAAAPRAFVTGCIPPQPQPQAQQQQPY